MSMAPKVGLVVSTLLCTCMAYGRHSRSHHADSFNDGIMYSAMFKDMDKDMNSAEAEMDLGDAKMTALTKSIEGVFQLDPEKVAQAKVALDAAKTSKPSSVKAAGKTAKAVASKAVASKAVAATKKVTVKAAASKAVASKAVGPKPVTVQAVASAKTVASKAVPVTQPSTGTKAKVTEKVAVSLPMGAFVLPDPKVAQNSTAKVPQNALRVQTATEKKEKVFEYAAKATTVKAKSHSKKFLEPKKPAPKQAKQQVKQPKDTVETVATKSAAKKVHSALAVETAVDGHEYLPERQIQEGIDNHVGAATALHTDSTAEAAVEPPVMSWFSPFTLVASWLYRESPSMLFSRMLAPKVQDATSEPVKVTTPPKTSALLLTQQDSDRTEQATMEDNQHIFEIADTWGEMEKDDSIRVNQVQGEDVAERRRAETAEPVHKASDAEIKGRHGVHGVPMSGFWSKLEKEDYSIEDTVQADDLVKYAELTQAQDVRVSQSSDQLALPNLHIGNHNDLRPSKEDQRIPIHEPWLAHEKRDKVLERGIHDDPNLQMLQLKHKHQRK